MVAFRYLRARRKESFISVITWFSLIGIALGVGTLIVVMAVMNGFRNELLDKILGVNGHVMVAAREAPIDDYETLQASLLKIPGVREATPLAEGQVMAATERASVGMLVRGLQRQVLAENPLFRDALSPGALDALDENSILLGQRLAHRLGAGPGAEVKLISPRSRATVMGAIPRMKTYIVAGTFKIGMSDFDSNVAILPLKAAQTYLGLGDRVTGLELRIDDPADAEAVADAIVRETANAYHVYDWKRANQHFVTALQVERNVMFLILTLIILVAAFNIISSLIMLVKDKGRDIAILRTMGATRTSIMKIFFLTGSTIGVAGTFIGVGLGLAFALNIESIRRGLERLTGTDLFSEEIYFLSKLPADVQTSDVTLVACMALGLSFLATLYPARRAARLDPAEALRYE